MERGGEARGASYGDSIASVEIRTSRHAHQKGQSGSYIPEVRAVGRARKSGVAGDGDNAASAESRASRHADQHGQSGSYVLEARGGTVWRGGETTPASDGDKVAQVHMTTYSAGNRTFWQSVHAKLLPTITCNQRGHQRATGNGRIQMHGRFVALRPYLHHRKRYQKSLPD